MANGNAPRENCVLKEGTEYPKSNFESDEGCEDEKDAKDENSRSIRKLGQASGKIRLLMFQQPGPDPARKLRLHFIFIRTPAPIRLSIRAKSKIPRGDHQS